MKKIFLVFMVLITAISISACNNNDLDDNHFVFATWAAGTELAEFNEIVDQVNLEANGEYVIETLSIPSDYYIKLSSKIAANNSPDFFWLTQELISKYAELGAVANITEQFSQSESLTPDDYYEGVIKTAYYEESYWGLPWIANPMMVYYNKDLFDEAGVSYPTTTDDWTWDEFIETARQFSGMKTNDGQDIFGYVVDGWPNIETFIWSGGGDVISDDGVILLDSDESLAGLDNLHTILSENLTPGYADISSLGSNNVWFEKQRVAMYMGGIQDNFEFKIDAMDESEQFELGYAPMPISADGTAWSFDWTAATMLSINNQDNDLAYQALEDMTLAFFEWKIAPPIKDSVDNVSSIDPLKVDALETIEYTLNNARSANYTPDWADINDMLWYDLYVYMLNDTNFDYRAAMKEIADEARDIVGE
jgi:multiple sugar transport system substrate-binding protein